MSATNVDKLRARVLYYCTTSTESGVRRLSTPALQSLLELEPVKGWRTEVFRAIRCLPKDCKAQLTSKGIVVEIIKPKPKPKPPKAKPRATAGAVETVFNHWRKVTGRTERTLLDGQRDELIRSRLREGHTVETLCLAADGVLCSPHHMGENDRGVTYTDAKLIYRDTAQVEKFATLARTKAKRKPLAERAAQATQGRRGRRRRS